jgi:hypothetical protein
MFDDDHMRRPGDELLQDMDELNAVACRAQRRMLSRLAEADRLELWREHGAHDMAHFASMRFGMSWWKADRWVKAAHALPELPAISAALDRGELSIDAVVELTRFATAETDAGLVRWASQVSVGAIRRRGDLEARRSREEAEQVERHRFLRWWTFDDGKRFALEAELPAADGAVVARAIDRLASEMPSEPDEQGADDAGARRADALVSLALAPASDGAAERATVVIHASAETLASEDRSGQIEGGGVAHVETVRRLACTGRLQVVLEDEGGNAVGLGRTSREPSAAMMRQLRYRDQECRFPVCGSRRFTQAHHIRWWSRGGRTDLENLVLTCTFHHKLVHEYGWSLARDPDNTVRWYRPDGTRYRAGPRPRSDLPESQPALAGAG